MAVTRVNTGTFKRNDKKVEGDNRPDYKGSVNIEGKQFWLAGWNKENEQGKFVSLAFDLAVDRKDEPDPVPF